MQKENKSKLLSRQEVEEVYGISKRYLEKVSVQGGGPTVIRFGRLVRYRPQDIEVWIEANAHKGAEQ
ncbi:MAG: AlpA family transcriptional regulator [Pseudomonadota bacterium]